MKQFPVSISGVGSYLPEQYIEISITGQYPDLPMEYAFKIGFEKVHVAGDDEFPVDMALSAAQKALKQAKLAPDQIDVIIYSNFGVPEYYYWANYAKLHQSLGARNAQAFNLNQCHNSQLRAIEFGTHLIRSNEYIQHILIVSADSYKNVADRWHAFPGTFLSDGASACVLSRRNNHCAVLRFKETNNDVFFCGYQYPEEELITALSEKRQLLTDRTFTVERVFDGDSCEIQCHGFFERVRENIMALLEAEGLQLKDIKKIITLNFNENLVVRLSKAIDVKEEALSWEVGSEYGHIGPADILLNLEQILKRRMVRKGDHIILLGIALDFSVMSCLIRC